MKRLSILFFFGALLTLPISAQQEEPELNDPHPIAQKVWRGVTSPHLGWGSTDVRYGRGEVPALSKKLALRAWRGERVSAQAVLVAPQALKGGEFRSERFDVRQETHCVSTGAEIFCTVRDDGQI